MQDKLKVLIELCSDNNIKLYASKTDIVNGLVFDTENKIVYMSSNVKPRQAEKLLAYIGEQRCDTLNINVIVTDGIKGILFSNKLNTLFINSDASAKDLKMAIEEFE